ncbi:phage virion morphogenesis protein [Novispirillum itersonii]|uniref:phage virion morphogenesis protein n=1 Tax=Novispirillum itersonii TaxID=189 RepID=UPI0003635B06|nr:phage virion morphogenesis protein [Novispirillum itersonii]
MTILQDDLEPGIRQMLARLSDPARRRLAVDIGRILRRSLSARLEAQQAPDGTPWEPRKPRREPTGIRQRTAMLTGLRSQRVLQVQALASGVSIGWNGRAGLLAWIHHTGAVASVAPGGPEVQYPARPLLGLSDQDAAAIRAVVTAAIGRSLSGLTG